MRAVLVALISVTLLGLLCSMADTSRHPSNLQRDPDNWRTYRAHVNHGIAAREKGHYKEAISSFRYAYENAPKHTPFWARATLNLAMCNEVLENDEEADKYYRDAGKFCTLSNQMRTAGAWKRMRLEREESSNAKTQ